MLQKRVPEVEIKSDRQELIVGRVAASLLAHTAHCPNAQVEAVEAVEAVSKAVCARTAVAAAGKQ